MNFKTPFKVLTTAALLGTLTVSAVAPGAAASAKTTTVSAKAEVAQDIKSVVLKKGDDSITLSYNDYASAQGSKALEGYVVTHVIADNGDVYDYETYGLAYSKGATTTEVFKKLADAEAPTTEVPAEAKEASFNEDGELVVSTPEEADFEVTEISAINATDANFTVKFGSDVTEADLKDAKLNLKGAQDLTASFVKLDGKTATYKVDTDIVGKSAYNGEYAISSTALKLPANLKTTYTAEIAGTFVEGFVFDDETTKPLAGATVTVDGKTTTTDANGYYKLAVTPGLKTVEISKGTEYFVSEAEAAVARNNATVVNKDLAEVDPSELYFTGTVLDSKDSKAVEDATVKLQAKNDKGEWENVADTNATTTTDADGKFQFGNSASNISNELDEDVLEVGKEYRAVVEKKVSASNLDDVYKKQEVTFTVSNKKPETTKLINADKVAELKSLNLDASVLGTATIAEDIEISFLDTDGATTLEELTLNKDSGSGDAAYTTTDGKKFDEKIDVVNLFKNDVSSTDDGDATKPRLVTGTYFMVVENENNATKAYAVEVTEGGDVNVKFEFEVAKSAQTSTQVGGIQYDKALYTIPGTDTAFPVAEPPADDEDLTLTEINADLTRASEKIQAQYAAYQTVAGKEILISETDAKDVVATFADSAVKAVSAEKASLDNLAGSVTYTVKSTSNFLVNKGTLPTVTPKDVTNPVSSTLESATKLDSIVLTDKAGAPLEEDTNVTVKSLKLVDATGKVVAEATPNAEVTTDADGIVQVSALGAEATKAFTNIKPGKYKLTVEAEGYKSGTSTTTDLIDFQNGQIKVGLEANEGTEVTGYIRYADDNTNVAVSGGDAEASVVVYDKDGDAVKATDFGTDSASTYSLKGLEPGEYTFVVRGATFETKAVKKTITEGTTNLNFDVVRGGKGQFKLQIVDEKNNTLTAGAADMTAYDAYYDKDLDNGTVAAAFDGDYEVTGPTAGAKGTEARSYTINSVSVGSYTLVLADDTVLEDTKYVLPQTYNLTLANINGTSYSTSNGTEIIKVPLVDGDSSELDVALNLTFTGDAVESDKSETDIDYVQVLDKDGNVVKTVRADDTNFNTDTTDKNKITIKVPNNATYTVKAYLNNGFVATETVTVQNNDISKTINVEKSKR